MTLNRSMAIKLAALVLAVAALGGASVWGLVRVTANIDRAMADHDRWRTVYERYVADVGGPLLAARAALDAGRGDPRLALDQLRTAAGRLDRIAMPDAADPDMIRQLRDARRALRRAIARLQTAGNPYLPDAGQADTPQGLAAAADRGAVRELNAAFALIAELAGRMRHALTAMQDEARRQLHQTAWLVAALALVMLAGAGAIGVWQHRSVMRPLQRMTAGVRHIAAGRLDQRLPPTGADELARLTEDFNRMAAELDRLYRDLENQVRQKSRALVQSERLASVGYLAAGVAHEINNPLAIIAGHAELAQRRAARADASDEKTNQTLAVIADEAFRCKAIIEKLLSLSRGSDEAREPVDLAAVARDVVEMVRELPAHRHRALTIHAKDHANHAPPIVHASAAQMKQVLLNLLLNALEATDPRTGRVHVRVERIDDHARITVQDNGRGMDAPTLDRVFEPFFTTVRGVDQRDNAMARHGTGLGLSICHAIVTDHAGRIQAHSAGPNQGSRFTITLPLMPPSATGPAGASAESSPANSSGGAAGDIPESSIDPAGAPQ